MMTMLIPIRLQMRRRRKRRRMRRIISAIKHKIRRIGRIRRRRIRRRSINKRTRKRKGTKVRNEEEMANGNKTRIIKGMST